MNETKPRPFCGSELIEVVSDGPNDDGDYWARVQCTACHVRIRVESDVAEIRTSLETEARRRWNLRVAPEIQS